MPDPSSRPPLLNPDEALTALKRRMTGHETIGLYKPIRALKQ